jgi:hypothetical protein
VHPVSELEARDDALERRLSREGEAWRAERVGCPHPDLLLGRSSDALDAGVRTRLTQHLTECPHCSRLVGDLEQLDLDEPDRTMEDRVLSRITSSRRVGAGRWIALAAGISIVLGVAATWWWARSAGRPDATVATASGGNSQKPLSADIPVLWAIEPPAVRVPLSSLEASRSGEHSGESTALLDALGPYQQGDFHATVAPLERVVRDHPQNADAALYLGVSYLMTARPAAALGPLGRALERAGPDRRREIAWYLATAEQRAGRIPESRSRLAALCAQAGPYQSRACAAEAALK